MELSAIGNEQKVEVRTRLRALMRSPRLFLLFERRGAGAVSIRPSAELVFKVRTPWRMEEVSRASQLLRIFEIPQTLLPFHVNAGKLQRLGFRDPVHVQLYRPIRPLWPLLRSYKLPTGSFGKGSYVAMEFTTDLGMTDQHGGNVSIGPELLFFDWDRGLPESNMLILYENKGQVPFCGHLLALRAASEPYSKEVLCEIDDFQESYPEARKWMHRWDAPCRKKLSIEENKELDALLSEVLRQPENSFFYARSEKNKETSHAALRQKFCILRGKVSAFMESKGVDCSDWGKVCRELFPRLTGRQIDALEERWQRRDNYIRNFDRLEEERTLESFDAFIEGPNPLSSLELDRLDIERLSWLAAGQLPEERLSVWMGRVRPSFRNTCCVKFPLLADVLHLYPYLPDLGILPFGPPVERYVGSWQCTLEDLLPKIRGRDGLPVEVVRLVESLHKRICSARLEGDVTAF